MSDNNFHRQYPEGLFETIKWAVRTVSEPAHPHHRERRGGFR